MFTAIFEQMGILFGFMLLGGIAAKTRAVPPEGAAVLSKLENTLFIPALVLGTFMTNFTAETLSVAWKILLFSLLVVLYVIPIAIFCSRLLSKDKYLQRIYTYGLTFSNFGFMGLPLVTALFPQIALEYVLFTIPLWAAIYVWGVPFLLTKREEKTKGLSVLKSFLNPMFLALAAGIVIGLSGWKMPGFLIGIVDSCGACMSPIAMILTGMTLATMDFKKVFSDKGIYWVSILRLLVFPCLLAGLFSALNRFLPIRTEESFYICLLCSTAMPLGLNTVVVPAAYGMDTSVAAGMALVSHLLSVVTVPLILFLFL